MDAKTKKLFNLIKTAFVAQDELNSRLNPNWKIQQWPYYRAVWTEVGEAVQHITSWLWWKDGQYEKPLSQSTLEKVHLELVDILHFGLSMNVLEAEKYNNRDHTFGQLAEEYLLGFSRQYRQGDTLDALETIVSKAISNQVFSIRDFCRACSTTGLSLPRLLTLYYAKYTLNKFRWDNGYNEKTYVKIWVDGREDNEHLMESTKELLKLSDDHELLEMLANSQAQQMLYNNLAAKYPGQAI